MLDSVNWRAVVKKELTYEGGTLDIDQGYFHLTLHNNVQTINFHCCGLQSDYILKYTAAILFLHNAHKIYSTLFLQGIGNTK